MHGPGPLAPSGLPDGRGLSQFFKEIQDRLHAHSPSEDRAKADALLADLLPQQRDFIKDKSTRKSILTPRRAGKTLGIAAHLIVKCLLQPGANCLYVAVTRGQARRNFWDSTTTGLKKLNQDYGLGLYFHNTNLEATFPNGSRISLVGADSPEEIDKLRGAAVDLVAIDEAGSFRPSIIDTLIQDILGPAINDRLGTIVLGGTPGYVLSGEFYRATTIDSGIPVRRYSHRRCWGSKPYAWSFHSWTVQDNTKMPHLWDSCLQQKAQYGWPDNHPKWRREYLGEWVVDDDNKILKFNRNLNTWQPDKESGNEWGLPAEHEWRFILGCDLGYDDDFALVVMAYAETTPTLYQVYEYSCPKLSVSQVAKRIKSVEAKFGEIESKVADTGGLAKMVVETLSSDYDVHLEAADRKNKRDAIELVNSDLCEGLLKFLPDSGLQNEAEMLVWDEDHKREARGQKCDLFDAMVYTHKYARHHHWAPAKQGVEPGSDEYWREWEKRTANAADEEYLAAKLGADDLLGSPKMDRDGWLDGSKGTHRWTY